MWGWITIGGMLTELLGFLLLSLDLLSEYQIHKDKNYVRLIERSIQDDKRNQRRDEWIGKYRIGKIEAVDAVVWQEHSRMRRLAPRVQGPFIKHNFFSTYELMMLIADAKMGIRLREELIIDRKRPPIIASILIVMLGVSIQIIGSWPLSNRCHFFLSFTSPRSAIIAPHLTPLAKAACEGLENPE